MHKIEGTFGLLISLILLSPEMAHARDDEYLDQSLPKEISVGPYAGERYEVEMPDTLDLVDHASMAIHALTSLVAPELDYEQYCGLRLNSNPPKFVIGGGLVNINPKWLEALPGLRVMTGSDENIDIDGKLMGSIVHITGKDGLCYYPVENRPWAIFNDHLREVNKPYSDIFGEGRQLLAYAAWYQHDGNPLWRELAERKIRRLREMALEKDGTLYFRLARGYTPWDTNPREGPVIPSADVGLYPVEKGMTGAPATYIVGFIPQGCAIWYRLTGFEPALDLGGGLADYLVKFGQMIDPETGRPLADHDVHVTHSLLSNLSYALTVGDEEMVAWVKKGFEFMADDGTTIWREERELGPRDKNNSGILISDPTCSCFVADMVNVGLMLTLAGEGDYWEDVDRWVRNTLVNLQIHAGDVAKIKQMPVAYMKNLEPGSFQLEDGADRCMGVFAHSMYPSLRHVAIGCCNGNCSRSLYYVWDSILQADDKTLTINLLMNRVSPWADIKSHLPYEGRVVVKMKSPRKKAKTFPDLVLDENPKWDRVRIRIPEWTDREAVACAVNGEERDAAWSDGYIELFGLEGKAVIELEFPMKTRSVKMVLQKQECQVELKGNTVVSVEPDLGLPLAHHAKYRGNQAPVRKVARFVSSERFLK